MIAFQGQVVGVVVGRIERVRTERATAVESAKLLKAALRSAFPACRFSVRLSRGTGYGYCDVSWEDGPTLARVREITQAYAGTRFDGMTDCEEHRDALLPDGRQSGLRGVLTSRTLSEAGYRLVARTTAAFWGVTEIPSKREAHDLYVRNASEYFGTLVHRASCDRSSVITEG